MTNIKNINPRGMPKAFPKGLLLLLLILAISGGLFAQRGARYAQEGVEYYNRGQYDRAISEFIAADKAAGGSVPLYHYWLARLHIAVQDVPNALIWMDKYLESGDDTHVREIRGYQEILHHSDKIFRSVEQRALPSYLGSRNSDYGAVMQPQGNYLYFTSLRPSRKDKENIWYAEAFQSGYGSPELVRSWATDANEAIGSFSTDGKTAYLFGNYDKGRIDGDIYVSTHDGERWSKPQNLEAVNSPAVDTHPFVFEDKIMFFTSSREGGYGGTDIWYSLKVDGEWQEPVNAGPQINTANNEQTPALICIEENLLVDGEVKRYREYALFFASDGHIGFGGYDLFKAVHEGPGWNSWNLPQNLGLPINSIRDDRYFNLCSDSNQIFFSSDRGAASFEKMFVAYADFTIPGYKVQEGEDGDRIYVPVETEFDEDQKRRTITFMGRLTDEQGNPVVADITFSGYPDGMLNKKVVTTDENGYYEITVPWADPYHVMINPDGYMLHQQRVPAPKDDKPVELNFVIKPLVLDKVFVFNNIQFDFDKATIKSESHEILNDIVITMLNNPEVSLEISGHTCSIGDADYNQGLSERRAKAVVDYLVGKKIGRKRLQYKGYGESKPLNDNGTPEKRALNRRVEVKVIN
jgi:OOP family OmpA-OmpF porin